MGRLRAEGAWNRWFHQRPRSNDQGAASNCEICTEASGTEQFLQAGVYFFFNYGIAICADSRLSGFAKNLGFSTSLKNIVEKNIVEKSGARPSGLQGYGFRSPEPSTFFGLLVFVL
tara:strand:+ start:446 stop:793 length:348 start_codon:yes stop_codon:yes gene_type:complete